MIFADLMLREMACFASDFFGWIDNGVFAQGIDV